MSSFTPKLSFFFFLVISFLFLVLFLVHIQDLRSRDLPLFIG